MIRKEGVKILGKYNGYICGSKCDNLNFLMNKGFLIPQGFILNKKISKEELSSFYTNQLNSDAYIVRSSANCEDGEQLSYAGMFLSRAGFYNEGNLYGDTLEVFDSVNNLSLDKYEKYITGKVQQQREMNVLVQEYIVGDYSGVYLGNVNNQRILGVIKGGNKILVDGKSQGINIYMDKNYRIIKQDHHVQKVIFDKQLQEKRYDKKIIFQQSLLLKLIKEFLKIEKLFTFEVDIEWTIRDNKVYILQVRAITS